MSRRWNWNRLLSGNRQRVRKSVPKIRLNSLHLEERTVPTIYTNPAAIAIPGTGTSGVADVYPSTISISDQTGKVVTDLKVTLTGLTHTNVQDLDILLVAPDGTHLLLMSDLGDLNGAISVNLTFDDAAATTISAGPVATGTYQPENLPGGVGDTDSIAGGPVSPPVTKLMGFDGVSPNGTWELRIVDDAGGDTGSLAGGWSMDMTTRVNTPPVANADSYSVNEDTQLSVAGKGVLANDTDADLDTLSAVLVSGPSHGTLTFNPDGTFQYDPTLNFNGTDSFTYKAYDTIVTGNTATVTINVTSVPDAPQGINDKYATQINRAQFRDAESGVLANDLDPDIAPNKQLLFEDFENVGTLAPFSAGVSGSDGTDWTAVLPNGWTMIAVDETQLPPVAIPANTSPEFAGWHILDIDSWIANQGDQARSTFTKGGVGKHGQVFVADGDALDDYTPLGIGGGKFSTYLTTRPISLAGVMPNTLQIEFDSSFRPEDPGTQFGNVDISYDGGATWTNLLEMDTTNIAGGVGSLVRANEHIVLTANNPIANSALVRFGYQMAENDWWWAIDNVKVTGDRTQFAANLTASVVGKPNFGTLALNPDGSFLYTPNTGFVGIDSFSYRTFDGSVFSNNATVSINIAGNVAIPTSSGDSYSTNQGVTLVTNATHGVLSNDFDADSVGNGGLTAVVVAGPANGKLTLDQWGAISYVPNPSFFGTDSFTYKAFDGVNNSNVSTVTIDVIATNKNAPVANNDAYTIAENGTLTVAAAGVLTNDTDADGNALTAVLVGNPVHGTVSLKSDGSFVYNPNQGFNGIDTFTYKAADFSFSSAPVTVAITVTLVDTAPVANDDKYNTSAGIPISISAAAGLLGNDRDDGTSVTLLTENFEGQTLAAFTGAAFIGKGDGTDWTATLPNGWTRDNTTTPYVANSSSDEFHGFNLLDVDSWVAALGNANRSKFTRGGVGLHGTVAVADPSAYDKLTDVDPNNFNVFLTTPTVSLTNVQANSLTLEFDSSYRPFDTQTGLVDVSFDGGVTWSNVLTYNTPNSGGPSGNSQGRLNSHVNLNANNPIGATTAQFRFGLTQAGNDWWWAVDNLLVQAQQLVTLPPTAVKVTDPTKGSVNLKADGSFVYIPTAGKTGVDFFTYKANDGTSDSNIAKVTITIDNVAPATSDSTGTTGEGTALNGALTVVDANGDTVASTLVRQARFGTVSIAGNNFVYTPQAGFYGTDTFAFKSSDSVAESNVSTVTINVTPVDNSPVAVDDNYTTSQGTNLNVPATGVLGNDSTGGRAKLTLLSEDFEGFALQGYQSPTEGGGDGTDWTESIPNGWNRTVDPNTPVGNPVEFYGWHLHDIDSWVATEGNQNRNLFTRGGVGKHGTIAVADGDAYDDGTAIGPNLLNTFFATPDLALDGTVPGSLTLEFDSSFRPEAPPDQVALTDVSFDGGTTWTNLLTFDTNNSGGTGSLNRINDHYTVNISNPANGSAMIRFGYINAGNDWWWAIDNIKVTVDKMDAQTLSATKVTGPSNGVVVFNPDGSFDYTPAPAYFGTDSFTYQVSDGVTTGNIGTVNIVVTPSVNAVADSYVATEDTKLSIPATGVLTNDKAASMLSLTAAIVTGTSNGVVTLQSDGSFDYVPNPGFNGTDSFTYIASDGTLNSPPTKVTINVTSVPDIVGAVQIDNGSTQRSMVRSLTVTFDSAVALAPGAFSLTGLSPLGAPIAVTVDASLDTTGKIVTLSFRDGNGLALIGNSLVDGRYTLTITGSKVTGAVGGLAADVDGDGTPGGTKTEQFHRFFGDSNGDATVAANDFIQFRLALGGNGFMFDFDGDGAVAASDFIQFRLRFGGSI